MGKVSEGHADMLPAVPPPPPPPTGLYWVLSSLVGVDDQYRGNKIGILGRRRHEKKPSIKGKNEEKKEYTLTKKQACAQGSALE